MVGDSSVGFNELAADTAMALLGNCDGTAVLDLGCGEGHVARRLARLGARVIAIDPVTRLLSAATGAEAVEPLGIAYHLDRAEKLATVGDSSLDAVVAVLVLHHVEDLPGALRQVRRVLRRGGNLIAVLPHPWSDHPESSWLATEGRTRRMIGAYCTEGFWSEDPGGAEAPFSIREIGWHHRTLGTWVDALAGSGFALRKVVEPTGGRRSDGGGPWATVPRFLGFSAQTAP